MPLSSTGGHGRGSQQGSIIGDVINHGKKAFWGVPNMHYHQGMRAGENTLNALCARLVTRGIAAQGGTYSPETFLKDYVSFMTTPGTHNDTYAESFHRDFFKNWSAGVPPEQCSRVSGSALRCVSCVCVWGVLPALPQPVGHRVPAVTEQEAWSLPEAAGGAACVAASVAARNACMVACHWLQGTEGHNTAQIGGFVMLPPVMLAALAKHGQDAAKQAALTHLKLTHESPKLWKFAERYTELLTDVVQVGPLRARDC